MKKRRNNSKGIHIHLSNRLAYSLIAIGILLIVAVGVYAIGAIPNPGHPISQLQTCDNNQILETVNGAWSCVAPTAGPQGPAGPTGATGPQGPAGPQAPVSTGLYGYGHLTSYNSCSGTMILPVSCTNPSGQYAYVTCSTGYSLVSLSSSTSDYGYSCLKN